MNSALQKQVEEITRTLDKVKEDKIKLENDLRKITVSFNAFLFLWYHQLCAFFVALLLNKLLIR